MIEAIPSPHIARLASSLFASLLLCCAVAPISAGAQTDAAEPLKVFATIPDLGALAREVGGNAVTVSTMIEGREDPHFGEARPIFIKELSQADVYIEMGMELEIGYAPVLMRNARNAKIMAGKPGNIIASSVIAPLEVPTTAIDRSMGDVHPQGNPHYLADPLNGLAVANLIRQRLSELRPSKSAYFQQRYDDFARRMGVKMVGAELAKKYDWQKLMILSDHDKLLPFLESQGDAGKLGGWLGRMAPYRGTKAVDDHNMWPYFAHRFGLDIVGHLEPIPGIPPTTSHLKKVIDMMKAQKVPLIISSPYYDPRHAALVAKATGAHDVVLAHQVGGVKGADDYLSTIDHNVHAVVGALKGGGA
jgi:ABC-type Zn uptake system ZnuABC Zn-binding protein ZnuA